MNSNNSVSLPSILPVFVELFSRRRIKQWVKSSWASGACPPVKASQSSRPLKERPLKVYERIFSLSVTLWYLIFQRLHEDKTQAAVVKDIHRGGADRLSPGAKKPLSKKVRSNRTGSYNEARQRMPLEFLQWALQRIGEHIRAWFSQSQTDAKARTFQLFDGSSLC